MGNIPARDDSSRFFLSNIKIRAHSNESRMSSANMVYVLVGQIIAGEFSNLVICPVRDDINIELIAFQR